MTRPPGTSSRIGASGQAQTDEAFDVQIGDAVVYSKYGGQEITIDGEDLLIVNARDVVLVATTADGGRSEAGFGAGRVSRVPVGESLRQLLAIVNEFRAEAAAIKRPELLKAMMASGVDPVPAATVAQARRLARQREKLLASGAYTTEALRELRGDASASSTRTWLARRRAAAELFTVSQNNMTLMPAFQLSEDGTPLPPVAAVLAALAPAGLEPWATWTWFASTSPWLDGAEPLQLLDSEPERVIRAASRFAANAA